MQLLYLTLPLVTFRMEHAQHRLLIFSHGWVYPLKPSPVAAHGVEGYVFCISKFLLKSEAKKLFK